ncbi:hypothetical protein Stsp01_52700 [Streptomyces sp. NBRC 13847]|nr:hypothetical protein Stsp01_52700 [Streptomyces sp. NBRC 13847]
MNSAAAVRAISSRVSALRRAVSEGRGSGAGSDTEDMGAAYVSCRNGTPCDIGTMCHFGVSVPGNPENGAGPWIALTDAAP